VTVEKDLYPSDDPDFPLTPNFRLLRSISFEVPSSLRDSRLTILSTPFLRCIFMTLNSYIFLVFDSGTRLSGLSNNGLIKDY